MTIRSLILSSLSIIIAAISFIPTYTRAHDSNYYMLGYSIAKKAMEQDIALFSSYPESNDWSRLRIAGWNYQVQLQNDLAPLLKIFRTQPASSGAFQDARTTFQSYTRGVADYCKSFDIDMYCNSIDMTQEQRKIFRNHMHSLVSHLSQLSKLSYTALL